MNDDKLIQTCVMMTKTQKEFLRNSSYNISKLFRNTLTDLMKREAK